MIKCVYLCVVLLIATACESGEGKSNSNVPSTIESQPVKESHVYHSVNEIIVDSLTSRWADVSDSAVSLVLYFADNDTLLAKYSQDCWLKFPFSVKNNSIVVYWDNNIETKIDMDIVMAVYKTDKKYLGQPFMELKLKNDTTLQAKYLHPEMVELINSASLEKRTFFPDHFHLLYPDYLF